MSSLPLSCTADRGLGEVGRWTMKEAICVVRRHDQWTCWGMGQSRKLNWKGAMFTTCSDTSVRRNFKMQWQVDITLLQASLDWRRTKFCACYTKWPHGLAKMRSNFLIEAQVLSILRSLREMGLIAIRWDKSNSYERRGRTEQRKEEKQEKTNGVSHQKRSIKNPTQWPHRVQRVKNLNCQEHARPWLQSNAPSAQGPATRSLLCRNASVILRRTSVLYLYGVSTNFQPVSFDWDQVSGRCGCFVLLPICELQVTSLLWGTLALNDLERFSDNLQTAQLYHRLLRLADRQ